MDLLYFAAGFQGAVAFNKSVLAAFENYLGKEVIVPENHEVTGAIGTAIKVLTPILNFSFKEYIKEKQLTRLGKELGRIESL
jgi:hypothetical protein